ncbi:hypothetical protein [Burkholderia cenocepacia]|uniref:hypothetical protein n=1 Tax=Burkholderia cenocepacia TaxID=95486 RepID=UPI00048980DD|nr:hypothetical protein [Burkholderia cenocepacia]
MTDQQQSRADALTETAKEAMDRLTREFAAMSPFEQRCWLMRNAPTPRPVEQPAAAPIDGNDGDLVLVERSLLGAACHAIEKKRDAPETLEKLRAVTFAPQPAPSPADERAACQAALRKRVDAGIRTDITNFMDGWMARAAASPAASIPAGWKLVPIEPTPEILAAIWQNERDSRRAWERAIATVPQPAQADAPAEARELPMMRNAFRVTEISGDPDPAKQRFFMRFPFPSIEAMYAADDEWRKFVASSASAPADAGEARLTDEQLRKALSQAWNLGQTYWQQADSEYASQNRKSDATSDKYRALVEETCALLNGADHE